MWQERDDWERESFYWIYYVDGNWYNYYVSNIITIHRTQFNVFFSYECFLDARCISLLYVWNKFIIPNNQTWTKQKVYLSSLLWTAAEKCSTKETATEKKKWFFSSKIPFTLKIRTLILFPYFAFAFLFTHHCMLCFVTGKRRKGKKIRRRWNRPLCGWYLAPPSCWLAHRSMAGVASTPIAFHRKCCRTWATVGNIVSSKPRLAITFYSFIFTRSCCCCCCAPQKCSSFLDNNYYLFCVCFGESMTHVPGSLFIHHRVSTWLHIVINP